MSSQIKEPESEFYKVAFDQNDKESNPHWLKTTFQLATIAGVAAGAVTLPYTGAGKSTALKALKTTDDAMGRYLKRNKTPQMKIVIDAVRKAPKRMANYSKQMRDQSKYVSTHLEPIDAMDQDLIKRTVDSEFKKRNVDEHVLALEQGRKQKLISRDTVEKDLINQHENARNLGMGASPFREVNGQGQLVNGGKGKESKMNTLTTNAIAGIGLGAGISTFHAIDDRVSGSHDKKDRTYRAGGSWLGQEKKAGIAEGAGRLLGGANKKLDEMGGNMQRAMKNKGAETLQNALIFNGAGLGFAKTLEATRAKARNEAEEKPAGKNGRIIIDLPSEETQHDVQKMNRNNPMSAMGGGFQQYAHEEKTASLAGAAKNFGKNLLGRSEERRLLQKNIDGGMDLYKANVGQRFGQQAGRTANEVDLLAARAKGFDTEQLHNIENEVGGSRMKAGLALGGAGLLGSKLNNKKDEPQQ